jgi:uncharacterized protein YutE (UPF0331/DUF86 family)
MAISYASCETSVKKSWKEKEMNIEFSGIERRLDELSERLARLEPFKDKPREFFDTDVYLRDIVERNLEIAAQSCIDICHRIIALENSRKPVDYFESILILGELGIIPMGFARQLAPITGFRNILVHEYISVDWELVYDNLQRLDDQYQFRDLIRQWIRDRNTTFS